MEFESHQKWLMADLSHEVLLVASLCSSEPFYLILPITDFVNSGSASNDP